MLALFVPLVLQAQQPPQPCHIVITGDFESQCLLPTDKDSFYVENGDMLIACQGMRVTYTASVNTGGITVTNWKWNVVGAATWNDNYNGTAFIAKYVDTSLMRPYVYSDPRQPQYIEWEQDLTLPLTDMLVTLTVTATQGGSTYGYYPAAPVTKLVTIHNVGIDDIQNSKFEI
ncbi:MAG: hypothetical protein IJT39_03615 [Bacteroidales bacterium]|nr:hypothetical protein [Bacteroidales bacterium]